MSIEFKKFHIDCPHSHEGRVPDHYPLTRGEVADLLVEARLRYDYANTDFHPSDVSSIQVRLDQAIPGQVCPRLIDGPVADAERQFSSFYVNWLRSGVGADEKIVNAICNIIGVE